MEEYSFITSLYDSTICRLCGVQNSQGVLIHDQEEEVDLAAAINRYLPITVEDDEKLPRTICPGCHIQVTATVQFFNLIIDGQKRIRGLYAEELKAHKEKSLLKKNLENARVISTNDATTGDNILIKIFPNEPFFGEDRELTLLVQGLTKPKRKPGRPRKLQPITEEATLQTTVETQKDVEENQEEFEDEEVGGYRLRKKRKIPQRFTELVAGRELDKVLLEEGAIDECDIAAYGAPDEKFSTEANVTENKHASVLEVIGHLQNADGELSAPILAQPGGHLARRKKKKTRILFECDFCNQTFSFRNKWIKHRATHKGSGFQCLQNSCLEIFTSMNKLRSHQALNEHTGSEVVIIKEELKDDEALSDDQGPYFCDGCGAVTTSITEMEAHLAAEHPQIAETSKDTETHKDDKETTLDMEKPADKTVKYFKINPLKRKPDPKSEKKMFQCELCWREFSHMASLIYHRDSFHNNGIRFACNKCSKTFSHKLLLQRHQIVHSNLRPYSCKKCDSSFKSKSNLINHQVVHSGEKKHFCDICGQSFIHKTSMNLHIQAHQGVKPYQCSICEKSFSQFGNLNDHVRIHYGHKPFVCKVCGKAFTTSSQQKLHAMRHTGERPWKCQYCGKRYLHKDTWRTHERRHTGEKPYECRHCPKSFSEPWSLKKHTRLHTGEKPYKCDICGKDFADCSNLTKHKKVHANNALKGPAVTNFVSTPKTIAASKPVEEDQIIYILNDEESSSTQVLDAVQNEGREGIATFSDEEGNPLRILLPDGRTADVLSFDLMKNIVHVRLSDGNMIFIQLSRQFNTDTELLECVRDSVVSMKPTVPVVQHETPERLAPRLRTLKEKKPIESQPSYLPESGIQIDDLGRAFIYSIEGDEKSLAGDFTESLNNVYFVSND